MLCTKIGDRLPGALTIPEQIAAGREPYYQALEGADASWDDGKLDVSEKEKLLTHYLGVQLASTFEKASKVEDTSANEKKFH